MAVLVSLMEMQFYLVCKLTSPFSFQELSSVSMLIHNIHLLLMFKLQLQHEK